MSQRIETIREALEVLGRTIDHVPDIRQKALTALDAIEAESKPQPNKYDRFVAACYAMQGILASETSQNYYKANEQLTRDQVVAIEAVAKADALLAALERGSER